MASSFSSATAYPTSSAPRMFNAVDYVALLLLIVGGLNWGLVGVFNVDLVAAIFGTMTTASRIVYALVGVSALYSISLLFRRSRV